MKRISLTLTIALGLSIAATAQNDSFALHNGDRVVFYGDSITDNGPYTYFVETFVSLRYPNMDVSFMNAGVGGDKVSGGWMGPIDQRMTRDLFSRKPTVVTSMLGMNDAAYTPYRQDIFDAYKAGYQHMAERLKKEAPDARVWLVRPSPFDDATQKPNWSPGYNDVLIKYGDYVQSLALSNGYGVIDMNSPMVAMLTKAAAANPDLAKKIVPDRVHPSQAGHLAMAAAVLTACTRRPWSPTRGSIGPPATLAPQMQA